MAAVETPEAPKDKAADWVRLQIEAVEVPLEKEGQQLLFSSVQAVVPGAHGLYYRENGSRRALNFDTNTGLVSAPTTGWSAQNVYIHLAHGTRNGVHFSDYSKASEQFEKSVTMVHKLIAAAGLTAQWRPSRADATRSRSKIKSGFEAQPENVHISDESSPPSPTSKIYDIEKLTSANRHLKQQVKELEREISAIKAEKSNTADVPSESDVMAVVEETTALVKDKDQRIDELCSQLEAAKTKLGELTDKEEENNNLHAVIESLREQLTKAQKEHDDGQKELAEHREILKNSKDKVSYLENQLNILNAPDSTTERLPGSRPRSRNPSECADEKTQLRSLETKLQLASSSLRAAEQDKQKLQEANWYANERLSKLEKENGYLKGVNDELRTNSQQSASAQLLAEKEHRIMELNDQRSKLEWRLGELQQWWNDTKWKVGELEAGVAHQKYLVETANSKIQSLNEQAPSYYPATPQVQQQPHIVTSQVQCPHITSSVPVTSLIAPPPLEMTKKVLLEITNVEAKEVFLMTSASRWKCAVRCDVSRDGRTGTIVELPKGRHEFRFLLDGTWTTSDAYASAPNGMGGQNNVIWVE